MIDFGAPWCCSIHENPLRKKEYRADWAKDPLHHDVNRDRNETQIYAWIHGESVNQYVGEVAGMTIEQCLQNYAYDPVSDGRIMCVQLILQLGRHFLQPA